MSYRTIAIAPESNQLVNFTLQTSDNVSGWTLAARFGTERDAAGNVSVANTVTPTIVNTTSKLAQMTLNTVQTKAFAQALYNCCDIWRVDSGNTYPLFPFFNIAYDPVQVS